MTGEWDINSIKPVDKEIVKQYKTIKLQNILFNLTYDIIYPLLSHVQWIVFLLNVNSSQHLFTQIATFWPAKNNATIATGGILQINKYPI